MSRKEAAMEYFLQGYNCTQSVVLAFADLLPVERTTLLKLGSPFGGGMGRLREVCGAVSGMFMVLGLLYGSDSPAGGKEKAELYARVQTLAHTFEEKNGAIVCRELLGLSVRHDAPTPEARTESYYKKRPCKELIGSAAELLDAYLQNDLTK